jgi:1-aminocyclopropane-1-carboxylate deaminase
VCGVYPLKMKDLPGCSSVLQEIDEHPGRASGIRLLVKRDDLVHPLVQGNKWRKLHRPLARARAEGATGVLSFGGPYSNYLHALALAAPLFGLRSVGIIRGLHVPSDNPTLAAARQAGMALHLVAREVYDAGMEAAPIQALAQAYPGYMVLPEGGAVADAVLGCQEIVRELRVQLPDFGQDNLWVCVPAGTGCTAAGIAAGLGSGGRLLVFPAVRYGVSAESIRVQALAAGQYQIADIHWMPDYILGKFGRPAGQVIDFARFFHKKYDILLDPLYNSRMMYGLFDVLGKKYFPQGSTVVAVHTGGTQGWNSGQWGIETTG